MNVILGLLVCGLALVKAIPIDNGLEGDPEMNCGPSSVLVKFTTQNNFPGKVYVMDHFAEDACKTIGDNTRTASIELPFDSCGTRRERSLEPRGVFVWTTVVISFHETFVTKIDRAIRIQCFYMEADKTVSQELEVSILTTELQTLTVPMPVCRYDILDGGPNGEPVRFTTIGQQVYHKWTCDTDSTDTFCMVVYDCKVDDGTGDVIQLLDDEGCALDKYLLGNLEYPTDLMGGREAHVFKYADRPNLYFNCQIRITIKEPGEECARPQCPSLRRKRSVPKREAALAGVVDVFTPHALMVADVDLKEEDIPSNILHPRSQRLYPETRVIRHKNEGYCIGGAGLSLIVALIALFIIGAVIMAILTVVRRPKSLQ